MPLFDFTCADCGRSFELLLRSSEERPACPHCASARVEKQLALVAVKGLKSDHVHTGSCGCGKPQGGCGAR
jgi:putative FmdB family regulatory protein